MNTDPVNLAVRFLLELLMLAVFGYWGWHLAGNWIHYTAAVGLPLIAAMLWGVFRIQNDPKPAPVGIPGVVRLLLEWVLFGLTVYFLYDLGYKRFGLVIALIVLIHYIVSYDRTIAMLRNKPYKGFSD